MAPLAPGRMKVEDMLEQMLEQRLALLGGEGGEALRIDAEGRHPVADGHPEGLGGADLAAPKAEEKRNNFV